MARTRTFIAVDVNAAIRTAATAAQRSLAKTGAKARWVEPEAMHVTLVFLGDVEDTDLARVCRIAAEAARTEPPFALTVEGIGAFPTPRRPKVIWGGIGSGLDSLQRLHAALEAPLLALGCYRQEERGYTPHLTLGRLTSESDGNLIAPEMPKLADWKAGSTSVQEVLVMSSELRRNGPEYTVVGRAPLGE